MVVVEEGLCSRCDCCCAECAVALAWDSEGGAGFALTDGSAFILSLRRGSRRGAGAVEAWAGAARHEGKAGEEGCWCGLECVVPIEPEMASNRTLRSAVLASLWTRLSFGPGAVKSTRSKGGERKREADNGHDGTIFKVKATQYSDH